MRLTTAGPPGDRPLAADRLSASAAVALLVVGLVLTFFLDRATGSAPVQHLYYFPIILAALRFGLRGALTLAICAIGLYHAANPHLLSFRYEETDFVQVVLFVSVGLVAARLADDSRRLHRLAMTDDLTGLHNLRSFEGRLRSMVRTARETGAPLSVLDLDQLKSLNDEYGHLAGASAVRTVGHVIARLLPANAVGCRYGGDEFVIAISNCARQHAMAVAERLCAAVKALAPQLAGVQFPPGRLTISVGVAGGVVNELSDASALDDRDRGERLFSAADAALYEAKRNGRNMVWSAPASAEHV
jgi:diguanylate cyclase (GGDEF)-like protein